MLAAMAIIRIGLDQENLGPGLASISSAREPPIKEHS
jgi:hypothetical protein